jgi:hypothetical protein
MASTIAAITTSGGGVVTTADSSGNLSLLSGATTVVAVTSTGVAVTGTLSSSGASTLTGAITATAGINTPNTFGFKNRIINGGMVIDQRNAGASVTPTDPSYTLDRCKFRVSQASKLTVQQNAAAVTPPVGFLNYLGVTSSSAYAVISTDYFLLVQDIEGFNTADLGFGTASAATVTLSFRVYSSLTGTFSGALRNSAANRSYLFTYTISAASTWTTVSVTVAGDTSGTWIGATNGIGLSVIFNLGCGATYSSTANSWLTGNYTAVTGSVSVVGTSGATFYITGVQLEKGSTATSFDFRDYGRELAMCQRYFESTYPSGTAVGSSFGTQQYLYSQAISAVNNQFQGDYIFKVIKRADPTVVFYKRDGTINVWFHSQVGQTETAYTPANISANPCSVSWYNNIGTAAANSHYGMITASSEL